jgi:excisionase family DNA binding protein
MLGLTKQGLYEAVRKGIIPAVHIGRRIRFDMDVLIGWAAKGGTKL